jgi:tetratricopeptide (TPR) repeat protein
MYKIQMNKIFRNKYFLSENAIIAYLFIFKILFHLLHPEYGYHRDELFYVAISDQFSFENLDVLPLTPLFLKVITSIFGYSIKSLHFASALLGAITLAITCLMSKELGGKKLAIFFTGLFTLLSGFLIFGTIFTYDSLDILISVFTLYLLVRLFKNDEPKLWILLGITLGLGLFNKLSILFLGFSIFACLWLVPQRHFYKSIWIWLSGTIALIFLIPWIIWQVEQNWYYVGVAAGYSGGLAYVASFPEYIWGQILPNNIFNLPVWLTGLGLLLFSSNWKTYRFFGFIYILLFFLYFFIGAKFYFLMPLYAILIVIGSIKIESFIDNRNWEKIKRKTILVLVTVLYVLLSLPLLPMIVPLLPVEILVQYTSALGVNAGVRQENKVLNQLPQHIADKFGWEELVDQTAEIYDSVRTELDEDVGIFTENWGQASAIHLFGKKYNLPEPTSFHGWYYYETLRKHEALDNYIVIGRPDLTLASLFYEVTLCGIYTHPYCMPYENNKQIYFCTNPKFDLNAYLLVSKNIDPRFIDLLRNQNVRAAIEYYHTSVKENPRIPLFTEAQVNNLGYEFLYNQRYKEAIALFKLNVEVFPNSFNVYDSLGEAYMENRQYDLAILFYNKSLELNPNNTNAVDKLKEIEQIIQSK